MIKNFIHTIFPTCGGRCALTRSRLHLIHPLGYAITYRQKGFAQQGGCP